MKLTTDAATAIDKLTFLHMWVIVTSDSIKRRCDPEYPENKPYLDLNDSVVSEFVVCRVVDIYQIYNRQMLSRLIAKNPKLLEDVKDDIRLKGNEIVALIEGTMCPSQLINKIQFTDRSVREHIHKRLGLWKESELDYLIEARNCIVHADGKRFDPILKKKIQDHGTPWKLPLKFSDDGQLRLTPAAANIACDVGMAQISIMDQSCVQEFHIESHEAEPASYSLTYK